MLTDILEAPTLEAAQEHLKRHPELDSIYAASALGEAASVARFLGADSGLARAKGGPRDWDALCYLCFSRFLRLQPHDGFLEAARTLLDAGADANTGWWEMGHQPQPEWESAIYGAAGVAHHGPLTRLLLERGADPNDEETPYHAPETYDNQAVVALVESGKLNQDSLATMLLRKADWHDFQGMKYLLEQGADANRMTRWNRTGLQQAVLRDNALDKIDLLLDHGADPRSILSLAVQRGRADVLESLEKRGVPLQFEGIEQVLYACARDQPLLPEGATTLAEFAGNGNTAGVRRLLDLGVPVGALYPGNGYFDIAADSTALHVAAWMSRPSTVQLLIERGADVQARDGKGRTPLQLAVRACVDSHWMARRTPEVVAALLRAGARLEGVTVPCGYAEVDELLG